MQRNELTEEKIFSENRLRIMMAVRNLTASELSKLTGISNSEISKYLNGQKKPTRKRVIKLFEAMGFSLEAAKKLTEIENQLGYVQKLLHDAEARYIELLVDQSTTSQESA